MMSLFKPFGKASKARLLGAIASTAALILVLIYDPQILLIVAGWWARGVWVDMVRPEAKDDLTRWVIRRFWRPVMRLL